MTELTEENYVKIGLMKERHENQVQLERQCKLCWESTKERSCSTCQYRPFGIFPLREESKEDPWANTNEYNAACEEIERREFPLTRLAYFLKLIPLFDKWYEDEFSLKLELSKHIDGIAKSRVRIAEVEYGSIPHREGYVFEFEGEIKDTQITILSTDIVDAESKIGKYITSSQKEYFFVGTKSASEIVEAALRDNKPVGYIDQCLKCVTTFEGAFDSTGLQAGSLSQRRFNHRGWY